MKTTTDQLTDLKRRIATAVADTELTRAEIAAVSQVHPSQVSRIFRGDFKTISHNVVRVCATLGLALESVKTPATKEEVSWSKIEASARSIWDKTPESAEKIAQILRTIGQLRSG